MQDTVYEIQDGVVGNGTAEVLETNLLCCGEHAMLFPWSAACHQHYRDHLTSAVRGLPCKAQSSFTSAAADVD